MLAIMRLSGGIVATAGLAARHAGLSAAYWGEVVKDPGLRRAGMGKTLASFHSSSDRQSLASDRTLWIRAGLGLIIIVCGLALRGYGLPLGLSAFVVKYGGSLLWAAMVFFLVAAALPRLSRRSAALIAASVAILVELFRLVHAPWLDAFRLTTPGALLLGRIFSPWNMVAYGVGILFAVALNRLVVTKPAARCTGSAS